MVGISWKTGVGGRHLEGGTGGSVLILQHCLQHLQHFDVNAESIGLGQVIKSKGKMLFLQKLPPDQWPHDPKGQRHLGDVGPADHWD